MKKTLIGLLLLLTVSLILVGCNGTKDTDTTADTTLPVTESDTTAVESVSAKTEITTTTEAPETTDAADTETTTAEDTTVTTAEATVTTTTETTTEAPTETTTPAPETPLAPVGYAVLGSTPAKSLEEISYYSTAKLIRTAEEFEIVKRETGFKTDMSVSFDTHSIVCAEICYGGPEIVMDFYGFDVVDGKVCPIFTVDEGEEAIEGFFHRFFFIAVRADSIAGDMGYSLVLNLSEQGSGSRWHDAYETYTSAPAEIQDYIELGKFAFQNWDNTRQAVIIRSQAELADLQPTVGIKLDKDFSFDDSSIVVVEFVHHSEERMTGFYGFDVVNGKVCPIITVETPTDPYAAIPTDMISTFALVIVPADSVAGMLGEVLVVVPDHIGEKSQHHKAYQIAAPTTFDWCVKLETTKPKDWNDKKDAVLVRSQSELDALGIGVEIDSDEPFSFDESWLVLTRFRLASSDENVEFYGFAVNDDGEVCPVISVEAPEFNTDDELEAFFLVCIPKDSITGKLGDGLAYNTLREGAGSAYHQAFVPEA